MTRGVVYPTVIILDLLLAGTAVMGGVFLVPSLPPAWLEGTPFSSYFFPALALTLIGLVALVGAIKLSFARPLGIVASLVAGLGITAFEIVQVAILTIGDWLQPFGIATGHRVTVGAAGLHPAMFLEPIYIATGVAIAIWSFSLYRQEIASQDTQGALKGPKPALARPSVTSRKGRAR
jgi:hypothetical protein